MTIHLTPKIQAKVDQIIESGEYADAEAVLDDSLSLLKEQRERREWLLNELRIGEKQDLHGETILYTESTMARLIAEGDEETHLGLPIRDAVKAPA